MDQHYVSKFYLEAFGDPTSKGQVWVADFENGEARNQAPKEIAKRRNYYGQFESEISKLESATAPLVKKLISGDFILTKEERTILSCFIGLLIIRVPFFRNRIYEIAAMTLQMDATPVSPKLLLKSGLNLVPLLTRILYDMKWSFFIPIGKGTFLTCDNPVSWFDPKRPPMMGHGLMAGRVEVTFPVGPKLCLFATWEGPTGPIPAGHMIVDQINRRRVAWAERFVFSNHKSGAAVALEIRATKER